MMKPFYFIKCVLLLTATQFLLASGCRKGSTPCQFGSYSFAVASEWSPQKEVYNVRDTIIFTSTFSKTLQDLVNPLLQIDYSNSTGISGDIVIYYLDTVTRQPIPARDSFAFYSITGKFVERTGNQNSGINFNYSESNSSYSFKGGLICKRKGIYTVSISNLYSRGIKGKNCTNAGFVMTLNNTNKNLHLHEYALQVSASDPGLQKNVYDFRVN